ncbi:MAG: hypothetical protein AUG51_13795 [Acidobacteria bacterium 13_1_20CM_3_53_8]|nr:MAG: hypothetical protein AUG51_13795 [Acidobacteria bacterium 13_1_20CM_3_53_8]
MILDLVGQEPIGADFIQADATSITVEINGARRVFKMDEVVGVIFSPDEAARRMSQGATAQGATSAREAVRVLRRLNSAIDVGVSYAQYSQILIEVKGSVDEALASIPAGELRNEITLAMEAYADAGQAWNVMIQNGRSYSSDILSVYPPIGALITKYSVPVKRQSGNFAIVNNRTMLSTIWQAARTHIDRASSLLNQ